VRRSEKKSDKKSEKKSEKRERRRRGYLIKEFRVGFLEKL
jgi:hypothetical protein